MKLCDGCHSCNVANQSVSPMKFQLVVIFVIAIALLWPKTQRFLVVQNANIWTGDHTGDMFVESFVVDKDTQKFVFVGSSVQEFLNKYYFKDVEYVNVENSSLIVPGFIDAHLHIVLGGNTLNSVILRNVRTREEFVRRVQEFSKMVEPGEWIYGYEWSRGYLGEDPDKSWIDDVTQHNPTILYQMDVHSCLINSVAMKLANITRETKDVEGGIIVRDENGEPTGLLRDKAMDLVLNIAPPQNKKRSVELAMKHLVKYGVTSVHNMGASDKGGSDEEYEVLKQVKEEGKFIVRVTTVWELKNWKQLLKRIETDGKGDDLLRIGILKDFVDGSLGSLTAYQFEPYTTDNKTVGLLVNNERYFLENIGSAEKHGLQVAIHAIGEKAIDLILNVYEKVIRESSTPNRDRRFRIEHVQQIRKQDIPRLAKLGIIASVQPSHLLDDALYADKILPAHSVPNLYVFNSLLKSGIKLALGTDWFVAPVNPLISIDAAVERITEKHPNGWYPDQKITLQQALEAYTIGASYAGFTENSVGMIKEGMLADFVILEKNLFNLKGRIKDVKVLRTYFGGRCVYNKD